MEPYIHSEIKNAIGFITFFHPAGNSFPSKQLEKLVSTINELDTHSEVQILVLQSEGNTFCAGASFDELLQITDVTSGEKFFSGFANVINAMRTCSKLIIGKAQGKAVGGGVGLLAACDYVIATPEAAIKLSELTIGIGPFVIEPAVSRKIGKTAMSELALTANEWKDAKWAFEKGLYSQLATKETLEKVTLTLATQLASYNRDAIRALKNVFWEGTSHWETLLPERAKISGELVLSNFTKNALKAFKK